MKVIPLNIPGLLLIEPNLFRDSRGLFCETFHAQRYAEAGITERFVQDNYSCSIRGTLRGLHYQEPHAQGKLVMVLDGSVYDVVVDIRQGSPTFGKWQGIELSSDNFRQLYVPPGCAHGFCVTSERRRSCTSAQISIRRRTNGASSGTIRRWRFPGRCPRRSSRQRIKPLVRSKPCRRSCRDIDQYLPVDPAMIAGLSYSA